MHSPIALPAATTISNTATKISVGCATRLPTLPKPRPSCMPVTIAGLRSRGHDPNPHR